MTTIADYIRAPAGNRRWCNIAAVRARWLAALLVAVVAACEGAGVGAQPNAPAPPAVAAPLSVAAPSVAAAEILGHQAPLAAGQHLRLVDGAGFGVLLFAALARLRYRLVTVGLPADRLAAARTSARHALELARVAGQHGVVTGANRHAFVRLPTHVARLIARNVARRALLHGRATRLASAGGFHELAVVTNDRSLGVQAAHFPRIARAAGPLLARPKGE